MTFGTVQAGYGQLRKRLAAYVGASALADVTIDPPTGTNDELSFIRLVTWGYVLLHETGRVPLGFLKQLPPWNEPTGQLLPHIRSLRTWSSHNLALDRTSDIATMRDAIEWFTKTCGVGTPTLPQHWELCHVALCGDLAEMLGKAVSACDAFANKDDHQRLVDELTVRLNSDWPAHKFDRHVEKSCTELGYSGLDVVKFRNGYVVAWRKVVATSLPDEIDRNISLRIQADLLSHMNHALPVTALELSELLQTNDAKSLAAAMIALRVQSPTIQNDLLEILRQICAPSLNAIAQGPAAT